MGMGKAGGSFVWWILPAESLGEWAAGVAGAREGTGPSPTGVGREGGGWGPVNDGMTGW